MQWALIFDAGFQGVYLSREVSVPLGSFAAWRTNTPNRGVKPFVGGETGRADLTYKNGRTLEVLELKRGEWGDAYEGETQLRNYVEKGNEDREWKNLWDVQTVVEMPVRGARAIAALRVGGVARARNAVHAAERPELHRDLGMVA